MTVLLVVVEILVALLIGGVVGFVLSDFFTDKRDSRRHNRDVIKKKEAERKSAQNRRSMDSLEHDNLDSADELFADIGAEKLGILRALFATAPFGMAVVNQDHHVLLINEQAKQLGLASRNQLEPKLIPTVDQVFKTGEVVRFDLKPHTPFRIFKPVTLISIEASKLIRNDFELAVIYCVDATESARLEKTRRDFVANVSHELKTPVGAISLLAEALAADTSDPEMVEHFSSQLHSEADRLSQLVSELMSLSRLQGAEKLPDPEEVSLDDVVNEAIIRSQHSSHKYNVALDTDEPSGHQVWGDYSLIVLALSNLVQNAIHYSPAESVVTVTRGVTTMGELRESMRGSNCFIARSHAVADEQELYTLRITDQGIGIAPRYVRRVFERFFRVDKARSRHSGGTGLGLAIVKQIALNMGGAVSLKSTLGEGSEFTLGFLPAADHELFTSEGNQENKQ